MLLLFMKQNAGAHGFPLVIVDETEVYSTPAPPSNKIYERKRQRLLLYRWTLVQPWA